MPSAKSVRGLEARPGRQAAQGRACARLGGNKFTGSPTIKIDVFTSAANWSTFTLSNPSLTPTVVRIPYSAFSVGGGAGATFSSAGAIRLTISGTAAASGQLDFLRTGSTTVPTPLEVTLTDVVLVANDGNGKASAGDTLRYVVTIPTPAPARC